MPKTIPSQRVRAGKSPSSTPPETPSGMHNTREWFCLVLGSSRPWAILPAQDELAAARRVEDRAPHLERGRTSNWRSGPAPVGRAVPCPPWGVPPILEVRHPSARRVTAVFSPHDSRPAASLFPLEVPSLSPSCPVSTHKGPAGQRHTFVSPLFYRHIATLRKIGCHEG
jgi:hypothetical protein